jgi:hypothetical protein
MESKSLFFRNKWRRDRDSSVISDLSFNNVLVAIISLDGFRLGKITDIEDNMINITLFNYKLDIKTEIVTNDDIILNLGPHQSKSIYEMSNEHQRTLLNRIYERGMW